MKIRSCSSPSLSGRGFTRRGVGGGASQSWLRPGRLFSRMPRLGRSGHSSIRARAVAGHLPMGVVRYGGLALRWIRVDCPNLSTSFQAQEGDELVNTNHGRSSDAASAHRLRRGIARFNSCRLLRVQPLIPSSRDAGSAPSDCPRRPRSRTPACHANASSGPVRSIARGCESAPGVPNIFDL